MNRIVIAAFAVVLSNFALACAGGGIDDLDPASADVTSASEATDTALIGPDQTKLSNSAAAADLPGSVAQADITDLAQVGRVVPSADMATAEDLARLEGHGSNSGIAAHGGRMLNKGLGK